MESIVIGDYEIEFDKMETIESYNKCKPILQDCHCDGCQNYYNVSLNFKNDIKIFFDNMGIDITKPIDTNAWGVSRNEKILYGGFYYVVGKILNEKDCFAENGKTGSYYQKYMYKLNNDLRIGFTSKTSFTKTSENFPENIFQMEILFWLPWILDDKKFIKNFLNEK